MLPLRRNVQYNKRSFFKDILVFVGGVHALLLALLFACDKGKFHKERFTINTDNLHTTVVFMPLQKRVPASRQSSVQPVQKSQEPRQVLSYDAYEKKVAQKVIQQEKLKPQTKLKKIVEQKKAVQQKQQVVKKTQAAAPVKKVTTTVSSDQKKKAVTQLKKETAPVVKKAVEKELSKIEKVEEKKVLEKKEVAPKVEQLTPIVPKKVEVKSAAEKIAEVQQIQEAKIEESQQVIESVEKKVADQLSSISDAVHDDIDLENVSFVGSRDLEMMIVKEQIHAQVAKYYKPPVGISKKAVCELTVRVGTDGKAEQVIVKKGSGSRANDMCARAALLQVKFPKEVIGKEIVVELGQS